MPFLNKRGSSAVGNQIYQKGDFVILAVKNGYIVHNMKKHFDFGHTHLTKYKSAKSLIFLARFKKMPRKAGAYFLESLIRVSTDYEYINKLTSELKTGR